MQFKIFKYTFQIAKTVPFDTSTNGWPTSIEETQSAIEYAKQYAEGFPRAGIPLVYNGSLSNNDWISYSNLTSSVPIPWAVNTKIHEITWANASGRDNRSFDLEIYKVLTNGTEVIQDTLEIRNSANNYGYWDSLNLIYNAGEATRIRYKDKGLNCRDLCLVLWFSRVI